MEEEIFEKCMLCFLMIDRKIKEKHLCIREFNCKICNSFQIFYGNSSSALNDFRWECLNCKSIYVPAFLRWFDEHHKHPEWIMNSNGKNGFFNKLKSIQSLSKLF